MFIFDFINIYFQKNLNDLRATIFEERIYNKLIEDNWEFWEGITNLRISSVMYDKFECIRVLQLLHKIKKRNSNINMELISVFEDGKALKHVIEIKNVKMIFKDENDENVYFYSQKFKLYFDDIDELESI